MSGDRGGVMRLVVLQSEWDREPGRVKNEIGEGEHEMKHVLVWKGSLMTFGTSLRHITSLLHDVIEVNSCTPSRVLYMMWGCGTGAVAF